MTELEEIFGKIHLRHMQDEEIDLSCLKCREFFNSLVRKQLAWNRSHSQIQSSGQTLLASDVK